MLYAGSVAALTEVMGVSIKINVTDRSEISAEILTANGKKFA